MNIEKFNKEDAEGEDKDTGNSKQERKEEKKDFFCFEDGEKQFFQEKLQETKELLLKNKKIFYDQIPTLLNDEIFEYLLAKNLKLKDQEWDASWNSDINNIINVLMEYDQYEKAVDFLKMLDISIPDNIEIREKFKVLKNYFWTIENEDPNIKETIKSIENKWQEKKVFSEERLHLKKETFKNALNEEKIGSKLLDEQETFQGLSSPETIIEKVGILSIGSVEEYLKNFYNSKLGEIGVSESKYSIYAKIDYLREKLVDKLFNIGQYRKALYFFDNQIGERKAENFLKSVFLMAMRNNDEKSIFIIKEITEGIYNKNKFMELKKDIENYFKLKNQIKNNKELEKGVKILAQKDQVEEIPLKGLTDDALLSRKAIRRMILDNLNQNLN